MSDFRTSREAPCSVSALVACAGRTVDQVGLVWLEGEIAQLSRPASGHVYLALRDRQSTLPAVLWAREAARNKTPLAVGDQVRVRGRLGVFLRDGKMQLYVDFVEPAGAGAAAQALEVLKQKLMAEGLFAAERKRALPQLPRRIGVVTSATSAAAADIIRTIERRFARPIVIADCQVQGAMAPTQIVLALRAIAQADVDVVIIGRGGGAVTDLAAFNDERVVRAVAACPVPVISAVGHEVDLTLCDFAADCRASTPTAAAELAVPVKADLSVVLHTLERRLAREWQITVARARQDLDDDVAQLTEAITSHCHRHRQTLTVNLAALEASHPRAQVRRRRAELSALLEQLLVCSPSVALAKRRGHYGALLGRLHAAGAKGLARQRSAWRELGGQLHALSPLAVLDRGFAVLRQGQRVIRSPKDIAPTEPLEATLAHGQVRLGLLP